MEWETFHGLELSKADKAEFIRLIGSRTGGKSTCEGIKCKDCVVYKYVAPKGKVNGKSRCVQTLEDFADEFMEKAW